LREVQLSATHEVTVNVISTAASRTIQTSLEPLEQRMAAAHERWSSARDPEFIRGQMPRVERLLRYFAPEVRHAERVPATGPALVVGNHSGYVYFPDVWATALALVRRRGLDAPTFGLAYDLLFAVPGVESFLRRLGALPAGGRAAEAALTAGGAVLVYPGGDWEACRPWTERNRVDFHGRTGFVRLALRTGVPVVPVVAYGSHHSVIVLSRGDRVARALGLDRVRVNVMPWLLGVPFGVAPVLPPAPLPAKVTVEFLRPLDWSDAGADGAAGPAVVQARYDEVIGLLQAGLDRLRGERPHPILSRLGVNR
jgi:1-acyl-sn-glycerol-3-phosphate acyltransferase